MTIILSSQRSLISKSSQLTKTNGRLTSAISSSDASRKTSNSVGQLISCLSIRFWLGLGNYDSDGWQIISNSKETQSYQRVGAFDLSITSLATFIHFKSHDP